MHYVKSEQVHPCNLSGSHAAQSGRYLLQAEMPYCILVMTLNTANNYFVAGLKIVNHMPLKGQGMNMLSKYGQGRCYSDSLRHNVVMP